MNQQNLSESAPDIIPASKHGRLFLGLLIAAALGVLALYQFVALPYLMKSLSKTPPVNLPTIKAILIVCASIGAIMGLGVGWYGRKIIRAGQYPLANAWVWRDTVIQHGRRARQFGWMHIATGALICLLCVGITLILWNMMASLAPQHKLRPGVVILQEKISDKP